MGPIVPAIQCVLG